MRYSLAIASVLVLAAASLAFGYSLKPEPPPVRLALTQWPVHQLFRYAEVEGHLDRDLVTLAIYHETPDAVRCYMSGRSDALALTGQHLAELGGSRAGHRSLFVTDESRGSDALVSQPDIQRLDQLRGRRIAVESGPLGAYVLRRSLAEAGLRPDDVEPVYMDLPDHILALESGDVVAAVTYEPYLSDLTEARGMRRLFDSRAMPGEIYDVVLIRESVARERPDVVRAMETAWDWAVRRLRSDPDAVYRALARELDMQPERVARAFEGVKVFNVSEGRRAVDGGGDLIMDTGWSHAAPSAGPTVDGIRDDG